jgi:hypothetical protein
LSPPSAAAYADLRSVATPETGRSPLAAVKAAATNMAVTVSAMMTRNIEKPRSARASRRFST